MELAGAVGEEDANPSPQGDPAPARPPLQRREQDATAALALALALAAYALTAETHGTWKVRSGKVYGRGPCLLDTEHQQEGGA
jgi:hypothetical protein